MVEAGRVRAPLVEAGLVTQLAIDQHWPLTAALDTEHTGYNKDGGSEEML